MQQITGLDFKIKEMAGRIKELREIEGLTVEEMAKKIYESLRKADKLKPKLILIEGTSNDGLGIAIMNRLLRTCEYDFITDK